MPYDFNYGIIFINFNFVFGLLTFCNVYVKNLKFRNTLLPEYIGSNYISTLNLDYDILPSDEKFLLMYPMEEDLKPILGASFTNYLNSELNIPILALSQLSRNPEKGNIKGKKEPQLSDLRGSGSIEQDADLVMFLYRRSDVEEDQTIGDDLIDVPAPTPKSQNESPIQEIILSIAKNRQGPLDYMDYHFYGQFCRFVEQKITKPVVTKKRKTRKN